MPYPTRERKEMKKVLGGVQYAREWNKCDRQNRVRYLLEDMNKRIEWGYIDEQYSTICYGMLWGIGTGRITAFGVIGWLNSRTIDELLSLLEELCESCHSMMDVVSYLNNLHIQERGYRKDLYPIYRRVKTGGKKP